MEDKSPIETPARLAALHGAAIAWLWRNFMLLVCVLCLLVYALVYMEDCFGPPIRADGAGYFSFLPAYVIYGDVTMEEAAHVEYGGDYPKSTMIRRYAPTGRWLVVYNCGVALMILPFFLAAHLVNLLVMAPFDWMRFNYPSDGYSFFYQHAAGLSGVFYFVLGFALLKRVLRDHFPPGVVMATLACLLFGTNLLHYGTGESVISHPYAFFLGCALLFLVPRWYRNPSHPGLTIAMGLVIGLIPLVRELAVLFFVIIPLYGISSVQGLRDRIRLWLKNWKWILLMAAVAMVAFSPQLLVWKSVTGNFIVNVRSEWGDGGFPHLFSPQIFSVLFGMKKGLLFWFPVLVLLVPGLWCMRKRLPELLLPVLLYTVLIVYAVSSYYAWHAGGSFGNRYFTESACFFAFPLACLFASVGRPLARFALFVFCAFCLGYTMFFMSLYYTREISYYGIDWPAFYDIFWWRKEKLLEWLGGP